MPRDQRQFRVPAGSQRERADKVLARAFPELSRTAVQRAFAAGFVLLNGRPLDKSDLVAEKDLLTFRLPEVEPAEMEPAEIPLEILYEDEHFLALNKSAGMTVHPGAGTGGDTLVHALLAHCRGRLSGIGGVERPGIVHRLDRETSGVMVVAKSDAAHQELSRHFSERKVIKEYLALVAGTPDLLSGKIEKPIGRHPVSRKKMTVTGDQRAGRAARTDWERIESFPRKAALLRCRIHTGRTHQIRVHLSSIRLPILGDVLYGYKEDGRFSRPPRRVMLHAERLRLPHPLTGEDMDLRAPLPDDFEQILGDLREARKEQEGV